MERRRGEDRETEKKQGNGNSAGNKRTLTQLEQGGKGKFSYLMFAVMILNKLYNSQTANSSFFPGFFSKDVAGGYWGVIGIKIKSFVL